MAAPPPPPLLPPPPSSTASVLPIDFIVAEILPKLPAKSLLRFKCVCKSFNTLISSPEFVRLHLRHSLSSDNRLVVIPVIDRTVYTFDLDSLSSSATAASATFSWPEHASINGSCNGLLLITGFFGGLHRLVLLNPSTRTYVDVPSTTNYLGFGFDHRNDDYKIVAVTDYRINVSKSRVTKIYSLNSKSWKIVEITFPPDAIQYPRSGALIDNHLLHWIFWNPSTGKRIIGCFDVCLENWGADVPLPGHYCNSSRKIYLLDFGVVDGRLFCSFENQVDWSYDVWVMEEYGVQESWTKLLSVAIPDDVIRGIVPVAISGREVGSSQVLIQQRRNSKMFWYNTVNGVTSKVNVPYLSDYRAYICKGSLVSLPGAKLFGAMYEPPVEE
ncbi:hypothetical protein RND81_13G006500 [Saponaria officinalis]|uniref:F-box domain-containing protein n=1 Tax=Saponaria officinalis TaxID=3572 RepID=A0AAW1GVB4_SAPOF